jgi:hypothetical protein
MSGYIHQNPRQQADNKGDIFLELRRKVQGLELLSASTVHLLKSLGFTGRLTVVIQNGQVLKSGYEEGYFRRTEDLNF